MADKTLSGTAQISDEGIKKHFRSYETWQALFELVWNSLDAKAKKVEVGLRESALESIEYVTILDDGDGVDVRNIDDNFGQFNDSQKKENVDQHGSHGRGRLAFHRLASEAAWWTRRGDIDAVIRVFDGNIKAFAGDYIKPIEQHELLLNYTSGTVVELKRIHSNLPPVAQLLEKFAVEFGWYLALNSDRAISLNGIKVAVPAHDRHTQAIDIGSVRFDVQVLRWHDKPTSEKSYVYLLDSEGKVRHKQLSSFNQKANFFVSVYAQSPWADNFSSEPSDLFGERARTTASEEWRKLADQIHDQVTDIYAEFLRLYVEGELKKFDEDGIFPNYVGLPIPYAEWRAANTRNLVRLVYMSDPTLINSLNKKQKKIVVRLLDRLSVSNENDALFEIISEVLDLDEPNLLALSRQLQHTTLEHVISTIELLQQRQLAVRKLRKLMDDHYRTVLETPDLQQIIENNTWLFGNQYETIGAEEDTFTSVARNLREKLKDVNVVDEEDVEDSAHVAGANRQTDIFLARKFPTRDSLGQSYYRCIIIEIKRPSIALNYKHLRQLDDYAAIVKKHPAFSSERMQFELILVGRKISSADFEIKSRLKNQLAHGEMGLVSVDDQMKRYVMNWYTLLDSFELSHGHLLKTLELKREVLSSSTKDELVRELQQEY
jgi:hypothetical protein